MNSYWLACTNWKVSIKSKIHTSNVKLMFYSLLNVGINAPFLAFFVAANLFRPFQKAAHFENTLSRGRSANLNSSQLVFPNTTHSSLNSIIVVSDV